jgi:glyoxylase-like metal-dependent hydrolase (beta-lactamase superfamily II)
MEAAKIRERVYADTNGEGKGNVGAIELPSYTIIVDSTISTKTANSFRKSLESKIESPVRKLILTHYHSDHVLGIPAFKYKKLRRTVKHNPKITFEKQLVLKDEGFTVDIVHAGGHTMDSSYIYFPQEKTLFSGDLIFAKTFFYAGDRTFNPDRWTEVLKKFMTMEIETIVPGHGPICSKEEVEKYMRFFEATSSIMKELIKTGAKEKEAVENTSFPDFYPEYREGVRALALTNWYRFYRQQRKTRSAPEPRAF